MPAIQMPAINAKKLVFMGTPDFAVPPLRALIEYGFDVVGVYTRAPQPKGRGKRLTPTPIHKVAEEYGLNVFTPKSLKSESEIATFMGLEADIAAIVAYGHILPKPILDAPKFGCVNLHASLLPRWRGAAPINRAIMAGDKETGIDIMCMDEGLDTGNILLSRRIALDPTNTAGQVHDKLSQLGAEILPYTLEAFMQGRLSSVEQAKIGHSYAKKISALDRQIDWTQSAETIRNQIMGLSPFPGAWTFMKTRHDTAPLRVILLRAELAHTDHNKTQNPRIGSIIEPLDNNITIQCGEGALNLIELKPAGSKAMNYQAFITGYLQDTDKRSVEFL